MKNNLIGLSGKIGSGKDLVYSMICEITGKSYENKKFADKIKDITCMLIGCTKDQIEDRDFKETPLGGVWNLPIIDINEPIVYKKGEPRFRRVITPRLIMQLIGTEGGRELLHPNVWVNALFTDHWFDDLWAITDVRFPNEVEVIHRRGGIVIRIARPCEVCSTGIDSFDCDCRIGKDHVSETALDGYDGFDYQVYNNGSIEDLKEKISIILNT